MLDLRRYVGYASNGNNEARLLVDDLWWMLKVDFVPETDLKITELDFQGLLRGVFSTMVIRSDGRNVLCICVCSRDGHT